MPASRKRGPIRRSSPMPSDTSLTSASTRSQIRAISLMNEIRVARNAFEAYLIISAVWRSVMRIVVSSLLYSAATALAARLLCEPSTSRSGCMKSWIALPSRRNSGFETTANGISRSRFSPTIRDTMSPVPIGTVLLLTMVTVLLIAPAIDFAACLTKTRSASPRRPIGVPTATKTYSASGMASP